MDELGFGQNVDPNQMEQTFQSFNQKAAPQTHYAKGIEGILERAAPIIGGAAGALGGAVLDPFTAGMASVALGGAGSALGQELENKLTGSKGSTLEQGVLGAVPGGIGKLADIGRAAKGGASIAESLQATKAIPSTIGRGVAPENAVENAAQNSGSFVGQQKSNINNSFQQAEAKAGGYHTGAKLPGTGPSGLSQEESQAYTNYSQNHGIPSVSAETRLNYISPQKQAAGSQIEQALNQNNIPLNHEDLQTIADQYKQKLISDPQLAAQAGPDFMAHTQNELDKFLGNVNPTSDITIRGEKVAPEELNGLVKQVGVPSQGQSSIKNASDLNRYIRGMESNVNYDRNSPTVIPGKEQATELFRQHLSDQLSQIAPDVSKANKNYSELLKLERAASIKNNQTVNAGGSLVNRAFNNNVVQSAEGAGAKLGMKATGGVPQVAERTVAAPPPGMATAEQGAAEAGAGSAATPPAGARGIPVQYESTPQIGTAQPQTANKLLINPNAGEVQGAQQDLANRGFSTTGNVGTNAQNEPVVQMQGQRTGVNFQPGQTETGTIPAQPQVAPAAPEGATAPESAQGGIKAINPLTAGNMLKKLTSQGVTRATANSLQAPQQQQQGQASTDPLADTSLEQGTSQDQQGTAGEYPLQNMLYDVQRDPANASTYEALFNTLSKNAQTGGLTTSQQNNVIALRSAQSQLSDYYTQLQQAGGTKGLVGGPIANVLGKLGVPGYSQLTALEANRTDIASSLAKAMTGSSRPAASVIQSWAASIPNVNDAPNVAQAKIQSMQKRINDLINSNQIPVGNTGTSTADTTTALDQLLASQQPQSSGLSTGGATPSSLLQGVL